MYLMGAALPESELRRLREFGGAAELSSRTKDPPLVDFSTGSMGLGCAAPVFAALTQKYAHAHFGATTASRFVTMSGDAELDEEMLGDAALDESMAMDNALWIVDLNRQSLDRVVPHIRAARLKRIFQACGWRVFEAKYGARLQAAFARPGARPCARPSTRWTSEEYQSLIRSDGAAVRAALAELPRGAEISACLAGVTDAELPGLLANLGGHDLPELMRVLEKSEVSPPQPTVILAYTIKGWGLPVAADPLNHGSPCSTQAFCGLSRQPRDFGGRAMVRFPAGVEGTCHPGGSRCPGRHRDAADPGADHDHRRRYPAGVECDKARRWHPPRKRLGGLCCAWRICPVSASASSR